ncbi:MAG: 4Fe-4S binding protein [Methanobacterium sp.]|uniref:4Fe-4S binding protein n=1 Tax=Methanobacterium sp. TaxID=2164 RepID=UPI00258882BB|nr:4Fe-4S binding protein [Methanobacterium sp.]MCC7560602.1 4Fe-4S binding protein [Methanobacterium sp.]
MICIHLNQQNCEGAKCGKCAYICPSNVFKIGNNSVHIISPQYCKLCKECMEICPNAAINIKSKKSPICGY